MRREVNVLCLAFAREGKVGVKVAFRRGDNILRLRVAVGPDLGTKIAGH